MLDSVWVSRLPFILYICNNTAIRCSSKVSAKQLICLLLPLETTEFLCSGTESLDQRAAIAAHSLYM